MPAPDPRSSNSKPSRRTADGDRFPTNAELLGDLTTYGSKRSPPLETRAISRRTRDYLLTATLGSAVIVVVLMKVMTHSDAVTVARMAGTAVALFCGLLGYVFYGVMSRY